MKGKKVYVAMSGGVDSSVAAALLKKQAFDVTGVFFKPWSPSTSSGQSQVYCDWKQDREDALRAAAKIGIPFKTWDFTKEYGKEVAEYMIESYRKGITPNPDVMCNKEIKFGIFLKKALSEGADFIATGHYAIIKRKAQSVKLYKAKDKNKDQTYFLWTLTQDQLKYSLFPIGGYTKPEVRALAKKVGLPNHAKKDSQGVCFVGELEMKEFLKLYIDSKPGQIIYEGNVIGVHDGASYYTIGQRHGLNITDGGGPYYVTKKDIKNNIIYVSKIRITNDECRIKEINWITPQKLPLRAKVKIRYRGEYIPVILESDYTLRTKHSFTSVAEGQSAVIYAGQEVLGGGICRSSGKAVAHS